MEKPKIGQFGHVLIRFASTQLATSIMNILAGFLVVSKLDPFETGQYNGVGVYLGYIMLGHGGILNGLSRELPYELGRKNDAYARELASSSYVAASLLSGLSALVFLFFSLRFFTMGDTLTGFIYLSYVVIGGLYLMNKQFLPSLYRTNNDFDALSKQNLTVGASNLLTVVFVYLFGLYGLLVRGVFQAVLEAWLLFKNKPYRLSYTAQKTHLLKLLKTGFPIFVVGQVNNIWVTIMNNLLFVKGGAANYGLYALAAMLQGVTGVVPTAFAQVIYPRMNIMLGEGRSFNEIVKANLKPLYLQFVLLISVAIVGALLLPVVIPWLLPKYVGGIEAGQWMLFVPAVQAFGSLNNLYNVVKHQRWYLVSLVTGAVVGALYVLIRYNLEGFNLVIFPQGLLLGNFVQQALSLAFLPTLKTVMEKRAVRVEENVPEDNLPEDNQPKNTL